MGTRRIAALAVAAGVSCVPLLVLAQNPTTADLAAKLTGTWKVNRELSPAIGRGRGRGDAAAALTPRLVPAAYQRGGGVDTSTTQDLTPEELAARAAVRQLQQIPELLKIDATADSITFSDTRGTFTYPITSKSTKVTIGDAKVDVKTKWDKLALRQEFNTAQQKLIKIWDIDESGRLVLKLRVESMTMSSADAIAVFDKER